MKYGVIVSLNRLKGRALKDGSRAVLELNQGTCVERYVIEARLGAGGMAVVYRARHRQLGSLHAIKILKASHAGWTERLRQEARSQSQIRHPNIVPVTDLLEVDGTLMVVMEYVEGPSLLALMNRVPPTLVQADALARGILRGVRAAHEAGLVHRDLKPANILVSCQDGRLIPRITDFGLVKNRRAVEGEGPETLTGAVMGTPGYMAPEQIRDSRDVDARADLFSLGAILYELVTHQRAFPGNDVLEVLNHTSEGHVVPPESLNPQIPDRMVRAITWAMHPDRTRRAPSCVALEERWCENSSDSEVLQAPWSSTELNRVMGCMDEEGHPSLSVRVERSRDPDIVQHLAQCIPCRVELRHYENAFGDASKETWDGVHPERMAVAGEDASATLDIQPMELMAEESPGMAGYGWFSQMMVGGVVTACMALGVLSLLMDGQLSWLGGETSIASWLFTVAVPVVTGCGGLLGVFSYRAGRGHRIWPGVWFLGPTVMVVMCGYLAGVRSADTLQQLAQLPLGERATELIWGVQGALSIKLVGVGYGIILCLLSAAVLAYHGRQRAKEQGAVVEFSLHPVWLAGTLGSVMWAVHVFGFQAGGAPFLVFLTLCVGSLCCAAVPRQQSVSGFRALIGIMVIFATGLAARSVVIQEFLGLSLRVLADPAEYRLGSAAELVTAMGLNSWWMMLPWVTVAVVVTISSRMYALEGRWRRAATTGLFLLVALAVDVSVLAPLRAAGNQIIPSFETEASAYYFGAELSELSTPVNAGWSGAGVRVVRTFEGHLQSGDVLIGLNERPVTNLSALLADTKQCLCSEDYVPSRCQRFSTCLTAPMQIPAVVIRKESGAERMLDIRVPFLMRLPQSPAEP